MLWKRTKRLRDGETEKGGRGEWEKRRFLLWKILVPEAHDVFRDVFPDSFIPARTGRNNHCKIQSFKLCSERASFKRHLL